MNLLLAALLLLLPIALPAPAQTASQWPRCERPGDRRVQVGPAEDAGAGPRRGAGAHRPAGTPAQGRPDKRHGRVRDLAGDRPAGVQLLALGCAQHRVSRVSRMDPPVPGAHGTLVRFVTYHRFTQARLSKVPSRLAAPGAARDHDPRAGRVAKPCPRPYHVPAATWSSRAKSPRRPRPAPDRAVRRRVAAMSGHESRGAPRSRSQEEGANDDVQQGRAIRDAGGVCLRVAASGRVAGAQHDRRRRPLVGGRRAAGGAGRVRRRARRARRCPTRRPCWGSRSAAILMGRLADRFGIVVPLVIGVDRAQPRLPPGGARATSLGRVRADPGAGDRPLRQLGHLRPAGGRRLALVHAQPRHGGLDLRQRQLPGRHGLAARSSSTSPQRVGWRPTLVASACSAP